MGRLNNSLTTHTVHAPSPDGGLIDLSTKSNPGEVTRKIRDKALKGWGSRPAGRMTRKHDDRNSQGSRRPYNLAAPRTGAPRDTAGQDQGAGANETGPLMPVLVKVEPTSTPGWFLAVQAYTFGPVAVCNVAKVNDQPLKSAMFDSSSDDEPPC